MKLVFVFLLMAMMVVVDVDAKKINWKKVWAGVKKVAKFILEHLKRKRGLGEIEQNSDVKELSALIGERETRDIIDDLVDIYADSAADSEEDFERNLRELEEKFKNF